MVAQLVSRKIEGLRFHDLRHTAITRMSKRMQPPMMRVSGHITRHAVA